MATPLSVVLLVILSLATAVKGRYNLTLLHTNDVHARFLQTDKYSAKCSPAMAAEGKCFGGIARRVTKVRQIRASDPNVLLVDAGDQYQGTLWFYVHRGAAAAHFMDRIRYDAMALGNHEFDNGVAGLTPFLRNVTFPVLSCNIDASLEPSLQGLFKKSTVKTIGGERIGIIGYTTTSTPDISISGKLIFRDEVASVQAEADNLLQQGINKIIAVGHAGLAVDRDIARRVKGVDVVVGGHTNTFLYKGDAPSNEKPEGEYPQVVKQSTGDKVLVVQDYAYGKYLGYLQLDFDESGKLESWNGNPILLDESIEQDKATLMELQSWSLPIDAIVAKVAGKSHVFLDGSKKTCWMGECNMGNFVADATVHTNLKHPDSKAWANCSIALINSGGIKASIKPGDVNYGDILETLPYRGTLSIVELRGRHVLEVLEHSVSQYNTVDPWGAFLQYSGMRVTFDLERPVGQRVVRVEARCANCIVPRYEALRTEGVYQIIMRDYMVEGGDGYTMIRKHMLKQHTIGNLESDAVIDYLTKVSPVTTGLEGRVTVLHGFTACSSNTASSSRTRLPLALLLLCIAFSWQLRCL